MKQRFSSYSKLITFENELIKLYVIYFQPTASIVGTILAISIYGAGDGDEVDIPNYSVIQIHSNKQYKC